MSADIFLRDGRPSVLAHRGSGPGLGVAGHRENTVAALTWAVENGADWLECDVQLSADHELIVTHNVLHDGRAVRSRDTDELLALGLDTLADVHDRFPASVGLDLDVKISFADVGPAGDDLIASVLAWADKARHVRPVLISSFCPSITVVDTDVPLAWITNASAWYYESVVSAVRLEAAVAAMHAVDVLDDPAGCPSAAEVAEFAREHDTAILAWGVEPGDVPELVARGVTGLCGDDVPALVAAVEALDR